MLFNRFAQVASALPASIGIKVGAKLHPYAALPARAERVASALLGLDIGPGDVVGMLLTNSADFVVLSQAVFAVGGIALPLDTQAHPRELEWVLRQATPSIVFARADLEPLAKGLIETLGLDIPLILVGGDGTQTLADLEQTAPIALPAIDADAVALYLLSSGSTGRPKIVPHTQGELLADSAASGKALGYQEGDVALNLLPAHHAFGFATAITHAPLNGVTTVLWAEPQPVVVAKAKLLHLLADERVTIMPGVPFLFDLLASVPDEVDLSAIRVAYSGAIALKKVSFDRFRERFGIAIRQAYGTTETMLVSFNTAEDPVETWNSVGQVADNNSIEVRPVAESSDPNIGELVVTSPAITKGYLDNPVANAASFSDGSWLSGDLGRIDADGNVFITGRRKLILEIAGQKVDPFEIEDVLAGHPSVGEAIVVGVPDPRTGEQRLKAVVVKKADGTADEIVRYARARLSAHKVPYLVEFREEMPRSPTGKVLRGKLVAD